jgi:hypothetical protein
LKHQYKMSELWEVWARHHGVKVVFKAPKKKEKDKKKELTYKEKQLEKFKK